MRRNTEYDERMRFICDTIFQLKQGYICYVYDSYNLEEILRMATFEIEYTKIDGFYALVAKNVKRRHIVGEEDIIE